MTLYNAKKDKVLNEDMITAILTYCKIPRSKESLAINFGYDGNHPTYFINNYIKPLIDDGILAYTIPDKPKSKKYIQYINKLL